MEKLVLNINDLMNCFGISRPKAYELMQTPGFPCFRIGNGSKNKYFVSVDALREWIKDQVNKEQDRKDNGGGFFEMD